MEDATRNWDPVFHQRLYVYATAWDSKRSWGVQIRDCAFLLVTCQSVKPSVAAVLYRLLFTWIMG